MSELLIRVCVMEGEDPFVLEAYGHATAGALAEIDEQLPDGEIPEDGEYFTATHFSDDENGPGWELDHVDDADFLMTMRRVYLDVQAKWKKQQWKEQRWKKQQDNPPASQESGT